MERPDDRPGHVVSRRDVFRIAGAAGIALAVKGATAPARAFAAGPKESQSAGYYRFSIGDIEATVVSDGGLSFQPIQPVWAPEAKKEDIEAMLYAAFLPADRLSLAVNVLAMRIGDGVVLVDSGAAGLFGPSLGKVKANLAAAGIDPGKVTTVILSHAHGDHFGGLLDPEGKPAYANAEIYANKTEIDYWTGPDPDVSKLRIPEENKKLFIANARKYLTAVKDRLHPVTPGQKLLKGSVEIVGAPGHTPGHVAVQITSGKESLLHVADTVHHHVLMFAHPEWTSAFDSDPQMAAATRMKVFERLSYDRARVLGYHLPFPGIGHVRMAKEGFEWIPEPWAWA
jgi:glyoxylase-like metal-dependent hydrolase (beta-lactamase superfamily II)